MLHKSEHFYSLLDKIGKIETDVCLSSPNLRLIGWADRVKIAILKIYYLNKSYGVRYGTLEGITANSYKVAYLCAFWKANLLALW